VELAVDFALGRGLVALGLLLGAHVPLEPGMAGHDAQVRQLQPGPDQQNQFEQPGRRQP
jgi:hypothetical protein